MGFSKVDYAIWLVAAAANGALFWASKAFGNDDIFIGGMLASLFIAVSVKAFLVARDRS